SLFALLKQAALLVQIAGKPDKGNQSVSLAQVIDDFAELIVTVIVQPGGHQYDRLAPVLPLFAAVIGRQVERVYHHRLTRRYASLQRVDAVRSGVGELLV